ncbi:hypothetical protein KC865_02670 [Candidatus Kaiserbacteria bacterium]|nr:hypothetical protein [Candidatus Kaiserbacteria bacterium]USN92433.1 MAG: hypothetical protein H6782_01300 [Candidatus Nomurabacteria bacterium]
MDSKNVEMLFRAMTKLGIIDDPTEALVAEKQEYGGWRVSFASQTHTKIILLSATEIDWDLSSLLKTFAQPYFSHRSRSSHMKKLNSLMGVNPRFTIVQGLNKRTVRSRLLRVISDQRLMPLVKTYQMLAEGTLSDHEAMGITRNQ